MSGLDLIHIARQVALQEVAPALGMLQDGIVETAQEGKAAVRLGGSASEPISGFTYPPGLDVQVGDHVLVYWVGGYQLVLVVLNRNATLGAGAVASGGTDLALAFFLS